MKGFYNLKLTALFSILTFLIQFLSLIIVTSFTLFLLKLGIISSPLRSMPFFMMIVMSIFIGSILAKIIGNKLLKPLIHLNEAIKKVTEGDFDIQVCEIGIGKEVKEMIHSFNIMTKELKNIETFRNDFVNNVSHEFKTPISAIEGYATLLQEENLSKQEYRDYVERILSSSKRLSTLSGNILMISKLENQDIVLDKTDFYLDEQIRNCILLLENLWNEKNITLNIDMERAIFYGNKNMTLHIWHNLLSNAIKFTPNGGVISIYLKQYSDCIIVSIIDTGIGMSEETIKHIFEKFYCADKSRHYNGNGLGLPLVKRIVELCDGSITVKSEENLGSEFHVTLPKQYDK